MPDTRFNDDAPESAAIAKQFIDQASSWDQVNELISQLRIQAEEKFGRDFSDPAFDE